MSKTINGKTFQEVESLLKKELPQEAYKVTTQGYEYIDVDFMERRFWEIFGFMHASIYVTKPEIMTMGDKSCYVSSAKIVIKDDNYEEVISVEGVGTENVGEKKDGDMKDMSFSLRTCVSYAKKACYHALGIGSDRKPVEKKCGEHSNVGRDVSELPNGANASISAESNTYRVRITSALSMFGTKGYGAMGTFEDGSRIDIRFWNDQLENYCKQAGYDRESLLQRIVPGVEMNIYGHIGVFKNSKQLIFESLKEDRYAQ